MPMNSLLSTLTYWICSPTFDFSLCWNKLKAREHLAVEKSRNRPYDAGDYDLKLMAIVFEVLIGLSSKINKTNLQL